MIWRLEEELEYPSELEVDRDPVIRVWMDEFLLTLSGRCPSGIIARLAPER
jgi:hypothetical protein